MTQYIPIICFVVGAAFGVAVTIIGFRLGFRSSYEIRNHKEESTEDKGLFKGKKDPAEFALLEDSSSKKDSEE